MDNGRVLSHRRDGTEADATKQIVLPATTLGNKDTVALESFSSWQPVLRLEFFEFLGRSFLGDDSSLLHLGLEPVHVTNSSRRVSDLNKALQSSALKSQMKLSWPTWHLRVLVISTSSLTAFKLRTGDARPMIRFFYPKSTPR